MVHHFKRLCQVEPCVWCQDDTLLWCAGSKWRHGVEMIRNRFTMLQFVSLQHWIDSVF